MISKLVNKKMKKSISSGGSYIGNPKNFESIPTFPHGILGIFISGSAHIGKNCIIYQHVTIGSNMLPDSKKFGTPNIGDNVLIGAGAKIIGNCTIGSNCRIGANAVVVNDVPDNCVVVNAPATVIQKIDLINDYYSFDSRDGWIRINGFTRSKVTDEMILHRLNQACEKGEV